MEQVAGHTHRIVLTGFMGSGKTTVGRMLAARLGWQFSDLDAAIEERCGRSVPRIFQEQGEARFRAEEVVALEALMSASQIVIALGGGAPETPAIRDLLQSSKGTAVVLLHAPFSLLSGRCEDQARELGSSPRPLLVNPDIALRRFESRRPHYEAIATFQLDVSRSTPEELAHSILAHLQ